jgi:hypothetical protein
MEKEGGTLPTRTALIEKIEQEFSEEMPQVSAMIQSQKADYAYYRPKMKNGYEFENIMITNLYKLIQEDRPVKNITINMKSQWSEQR